MILRYRNLLLLIPALAVLTGCEGFWGKKTDTDFIEVPLYNERTVAYVPVQPVWDDMVQPVDVIAGYDELIYVADGGTDEIISYDQSGREQGRFPIPGLSAIAMDRSLDLIAIGTFDTLGYTLSTLYRIEQKTASGLYGLKHARIERKTVHPFYYKNSISGNDANVAFNSVTARGNNYLYVARTGPNNSTSQFGGPDDAMLIFDDADDFVTPISVNTNGGLFSDYFKKPISVVSIAQPPQSPFVSNSGDFVFSSLSSNTVLKVQYIRVTETENGTDYTVKEMVYGDTAKAEGFLNEPSRFAAPVDITYTGDGTNYIFVVDSEKDSLYQFTNTGLEGVAPPQGSSLTKNILASFGGTGTSLTQFDQPSGVAYLNRTLYVADKGNGRVLRFKLTTDLN